MPGAAAAGGSLGAMLSTGGTVTGASGSVSDGEAGARGGGSSGSCSTGGSSESHLVIEEPGRGGVVDDRPAGAGAQEREGDHEHVGRRDGVPPAQRLEVADCAQIRGVLQVEGDQRAVPGAEPSPEDHVSRLVGQ